MSFEPAPVRDWLVESGLADVGVGALLDGLCRRLADGGIGVRRCNLSFATLHPVQWASAIVWRDGRIVEAVDYPHGSDRAAVFRTSPLRLMLETRSRRLRRRLAGEGATLDFPVLAEFRDAGLTDWFALLESFGWAVDVNPLGELGIITTWATDRPGGWPAQELAVLEELAGPLALAVKAMTARGTAQELLAAYLGPRSAARVVAGQVRRGSVERTAAVILYADIRGFTDFAETAAPEEVTRRLNAAFECMGGPVAGAGGEVLKFLGDGLLAMFRPDGERDMAAVAAAALGAARDILARIAELDATEAAAGNPPLPVDIALHQGEVTYGNVGTADRLDFTVIGPAVNQAARLEGLCKEVGRRLVVSDSFVRAAPALALELRSLGRHRLRGVAEPIEVFAAD
jgi:adenylate cyclase